ncbi:uncharacterized protein (DUF697 family)/GTP-binding protein EngB required for normal cell division [Friedmanniella endophytica]|uniref:Uncharacterized protein (DUF697 family)/GTP-binding protein EngB required for normal cell division n=1 Tax=Microlunatus kandeliicorticis TaxID=1759536 RepID=A0A7W3IVW6_9ACTN|nr:GTP-binding DUF697 domain-containing protein [Microlunatus kandeliicorticis]MBA8796253.1 uncharacterized protein (DUF697 family)/GTP-binding protein EngB required for normal cell division [Microlunatus kandeliicorticis]
MPDPDDWFRESFRSEYERQSAALGRFNLAIFGKTGVGKSTLINAVFGEEVAATGIGEPVTKDSHLYLDKRGHLGILDTQGLEVGVDDKVIINDLRKAMKQMRHAELAEQLHVAWYCVRGMDRRFEQTEADFVRQLDELGLPVIVVLTQVPMRDGQYHPDALALSQMITGQQLPIFGRRPFLTFAKPDPFTGQQSHGLPEVLDATFRCAPAGVEGALTAAQQIDQDRKARTAQGVIGAAAGSAAAAAAVPIPFSDAAMLVPIQLGMMAKIAQLYSIKVERAGLMAIAATTAATQVGRSTFTGLLKLVPGAGSVVGGVVGAGVASAYTLAMGQAWLVVCQRMSRGGLGGPDAPLDNAAVRELFLAEFRKRLGSIRRQEVR